MPPGTYGRVAPRSGLAVKNFVDTGAGVVDEDYRGNVGVVLFNHGDADFVGARWRRPFAADLCRHSRAPPARHSLTAHSPATAVKKGDRVAQLVLERIATPEVLEVADLDDTARGAGGYGSTGVAAAI